MKKVSKLVYSLIKKMNPIKENPSIRNARFCRICKTPFKNGDIIVRDITLRGISEGLRITNVIIILKKYLL